MDNIGSDILPDTQQQGEGLRTWLLSNTKYYSKALQHRVEVMLPKTADILPKFTTATLSTSADILPTHSGYSLSVSGYIPQTHNSYSLNISGHTPNAQQLLSQHQRTYSQTHNSYFLNISVHTPKRTAATLSTSAVILPQLTAVTLRILKHAFCCQFGLSSRFYWETIISYNTCFMGNNFAHSNQLSLHQNLNAKTFVKQIHLTSSINPV